MRRTLIVATFVATFWVAPAWAAMTIDGYSPARHDRFYTGVDKAFIGESFDWSGVGRNTDGLMATMISSQYFVSSTHYVQNYPPGDKTFRFYLTNDPNGAFEDYTVESGQVIGDSDLWLGKLTTPVSENIATYPVLGLPSDAAYDNRLIYIYGRSDTAPVMASVRVGLNNIDPGSIDDVTADQGTPSERTGRAFTFDYDPMNGQGDDESFLRDGDSSGPSMAVVNGSLALVGLHWFNSFLDDQKTIPSESGDTFVPYYIADLNAAMIGESVTVVPEPTSLVLGILAVLGTAAFAWRRRVRL